MLLQMGDIVLSIDRIKLSKQSIFICECNNNNNNNNITKQEIIILKMKQTEKEYR